MTSQAIAQAIVVAASAAQKTQNTRSLIPSVTLLIKNINAPQWGSLAVVLAGLLIGFTRFRGQWVGRVALPLIVFAYLGFGAGVTLPGTTLGLVRPWDSSNRPSITLPFYRCHPGTYHNRSKYLLHSTLRTRSCTAASENFNPSPSCRHALATTKTNQPCFKTVAMAVMGTLGSLLSHNGVRSTVCSGRL